MSNTKLVVSKVKTDIVFSITNKYSQKYLCNQIVAKLGLFLWLLLGI